MSEVTLIRWDAPGPYAVAFSTRRGGVSEAPFDTLNLGRLTDDDPNHVAENRERLCHELGTSPSSSPTASRYTVRLSGGLEPGEPGDGLWTDRPGEPLLVFTADCLPIAIARVDVETPAVAALHVGWRGLLAGIVRGAAATLGPGWRWGSGRESARVVTRSATRWPRRSAIDSVTTSFATAGSTSGPPAARSLEAAGVVDVHRTDLCTACNPELFFSHRRDAGRTGRQGMIAYVT